MRRYFPALLLVLSLAILGKGVIGVAGVLHPPVAVPKAEQRAEAASDALREASDITHLAASIESLATALAADPPRRSLLHEVLPHGSDTATASALPQREIEVIYLTGDYRRAVVDGRLVAEGDSLPEGGMVRRITEAGVLVDERRGRQTLRVEHERLIVGSVHRVKQEEAP